MNIVALDRRSAHRGPIVDMELQAPDDQVTATGDARFGGWWCVTFEDGSHQFVYGADIILIDRTRVGVAA